MAGDVHCSARVNSEAGGIIVERAAHVGDERIGRPLRIQLQEDDFASSVHVGLDSIDGRKTGVLESLAGDVRTSGRIDRDKEWIWSLEERPVAPVVRVQKVHE